MTLAPIFVDFSASPPRTNAERVHGDRAEHAKDHWNINRRGCVRVEFSADGPGDEATLMIRALVSRLGPKQGYSPLDVILNGHSVMAGYRLPGGGDLPQDVALAIDGRWLQDGINTLELRTAENATSMLWLYHVLLESVANRGEAHRAMLDEAVTELALSYDTQTCGAISGAWRPGPPLRLLIESERPALPSRLTWRCTNGSQAAIVFALEFTSFFGHIRNKEGQWLLYRGDLIDRGAEPHGSAQRFRTEISWGELTTWYQSLGLTFYLDTGYGPLEQVGWTDVRGSSASISLASDGKSFSGYAQNPEEGPIAFRGHGLSS